MRLLRLNNWGTLSRLAKGQLPGPESSITKLRWTEMTQHLSDVALEILGERCPFVTPVRLGIAALPSRGPSRFWSSPRWAASIPS